MTSTVIITSAKPNNNLIAIHKQTIDGAGGSVGASVQAAMLDDGDAVTLKVGPHQVLVILEQPRGAEAQPGQQSGVQPSEPTPQIPPTIGSGQGETPPTAEIPTSPAA